MARFILGHRLRAWGARNARVEHALYWLDRRFFGLLLWLIRRFPLEPAVRFGEAIGAGLGPRFKKSRALIQNLRVAFPEWSEERLQQTTRLCWANAGAVLAEYAHLEEICEDGTEPRLQIEIRADIASFRDPSIPAIFVTAHQANWELVGAAIVRQGVPLSCVYSPPTNPLLDELLARWRRKIGCELLPSDDSMRPMMRALSQGRSLGIVMDRRVDSGKPVMFFGHEKPSTLIPARLALRYNAELVPVRIERLHNARFRVSFLPPLRPEPGFDQELPQALAMTRRIHALFEDWIRDRPGQWFCSKRLWPKDVYTTGTPAHAASPPVQESTDE